VPSPAARRSPVWLRNLLWLWLGAWIGAMALFGAMTRAAFRVVGDPATAGALVGELLHPMLALSAVSGVGLALIAARLQRGRFTIGLSLVLATASLINQFGVSPAVAEIQLTDPNLVPELAARFAALHRLSVWLFVGTGVGAAVLAFAHGLAEIRQARELRPEAAAALAPDEKTARKPA